MEAPQKCPSCKGKEFEQSRQRDERQVAGFTFAAELTIYRCKSCTEVLFVLSEIGQFEKQIAGWLARKGILSGEAFRFMRKSIGLRASELAPLLDLTSETISRWEKEHRLPDRKAMMVLGALVLEQLAGRDEILKRLQSLGSCSQTGESIDLTDSLRVA